jgi:transcriptional regulator with XRE-family HTH domain
MKKSPMRRARENAGLTIEKIAIETGIAYATVQALESGRGAGYSVVSKEKIAAFLCMDFFTLWPEERERMSLAFKAGMAAAQRKAKGKERDVSK